MPVARALPAAHLSVQPPEARRQLAGMLAERQWDGDVEGAVLAVHEALVNAERHAGGAQQAAARLEGSTLLVEVCDEGPGFTLPDDAVQPEPTAEAGRGLWLIKHLASSCDVRRNKGGVCLRLRFER